MSIKKKIRKWLFETWNKKLCKIRNYITLIEKIIQEIFGSFYAWKTNILGRAYEQKMAKETARYKWVLVIDELFNMAVNDFDGKKSAPYSRVLVVTELVVSGTQCNCFGVVSGCVKLKGTP